MKKYPLHDLRRTWVPLLKTAAASGADIWGDYTFYKSTSIDNNVNLEVYELPLFIFFIVSCVMGGLTIFTLICKGCCPQNQHAKKMRSQGKEVAKDCSLMGCLSFTCCVNRINQILSLEIILEDIPQFILTSLIINEKGLLTPAAAFNITTSAFNFVFNIFDMITPDPDDDDDGKKDDGDVESADEA